MSRGYSGGVFLALAILATLGGLPLAVPASHCAVVTQRLYAKAPVSGPQLHWENTDEVFGPPEGDCNDGANPQYAWNDVATSTEWLTVGNWDPFDLLPGYVVSQVLVDVNGRYDNPSSGNRFNLRIGGAVDIPLVQSPPWPQDSYDCDWRFGESGAAVTNFLDRAWTAADISGLEVAIQRIDNNDSIEPKRARLNAVRITVVSTNDQALTVTPDILDFGRIEPGEVAQLSTTLRNAGVGTISIDVPALCGPFEVIENSGPYVLAEGENRIITVRYAPQDQGPAACQLDLGTQLHGPVPIFANSCDEMVIPPGTVVSAQNTTYDNKNVIVRNGTVTIDGEHTFCRLTLESGVITHTANSAAGMTLHVLTDLHVDAASSIEISGRGSPAGQGPGAGTTGSTGAGHGGRGAGGGGGATYGNHAQPLELGSGGAGGGYAGAGGGVVRLVVDGSLIVDGSIRATGYGGTEGIYGSGGGGSGGSVWLNAGILAGAGEISANGGSASSGGGGGGGRIAIYFDQSDFTGTLSAHGGSSTYSQGGGGGTILTKRASSSLGELLVANANMTNAARTDLADGERIAAHLRVNAGGVLGRVKSVRVSGDVTIESTGAISANGSGYLPQTGPGAGTQNAGAGHGGSGGGTGGGGTYGSYAQPVDLGSGGGGTAGYAGAGGGVITLTVDGVLTVDGAISSNGNGGGDHYVYSGSGGSGGSVWLNAGRFAGAGVVSAVGGGAASGGGGGGGRIAIYFDESDFTGSLSARGGASSGSQSGGGGTIFTKPANISLGELLVANASMTNAARTDLAESEFIAANVRVNSGGVLGRVHNVQVSGDVTIESTGAISANGTGYPAQTGPGAGTQNAGAGHGGSGGGTGGGGTYGSYAQPVAQGSGGGGTLGYAGAGGGVIRLAIDGVLTVDGSINANGNGGYDHYVYSGSGGSGGSIWLSAGQFAGTGEVSANGGGASSGGAGGGGRIAIYFGQSDFAGTLNARGGISSGSQNGGGGTIFTKFSSSTLGELLVANGNLTNAARTDLAEGELIGANLRVNSGGVLGRVHNVRVSGNMVIESSGAVSANGRGFPGLQGPGAGSGGGGGGHGGRGGGTDGGATYGDRTYPVDMGSGGAGTQGYAGAGGGVIRLAVDGALVVDGVISANGGNGTNHYIYSGAGGSGGSVNVSASRLSGTGMITAQGGNSQSLGSGGGGRIALFCADRFADFDTLAHVSVAAGSGPAVGSAGSRYFAFDRPGYPLSIGDIAGIDDGFAAPSEPADPSAHLVNALLPMTVTGFDEIPGSAAVAHTFTLFAVDADSIVDAKIIFRARAGGHSDAIVDQVTLGFADENGFDRRWSRRFGPDDARKTSGLGERLWINGADSTFVLNINRLPLDGGGTLDLLGEMLLNGHLEFVVESNTSVDYVAMSWGLGQGVLSGVDDEISSTVPAFSALASVTPNPFNPSTTVAYDVARPSEVIIELFDVRGRKVETLLRQNMQPGRYDLAVDGSHLGSGVYIVRMRTGDTVNSRKMVLLK